MLQKISEIRPDIEFLKADGLDMAVIGYDNNGPERLIYSVRKVLMILMERDKMTPDEAQEFFEFNIEGAYVGEQTPIWCQDCF